jgi:hypothetical protein
LFSIPLEGHKKAFPKQEKDADLALQTGEFDARWLQK